MEKIIHNSVKIPIYYGRLDVYVCPDFRDVNKKYKLGLNDADIIDCDGYNNENKKWHLKYFVMLQPTIPVESIAHESKHIVNRIFLNRGQALDLINDEAECYFLGWVYKQLFDAVVKYLKK